MSKVNNVRFLQLGRNPVHKNKAECTFLGLRDGWLRDREMLIVDDKYNFITARAFPKMLLIQSKIEKSILTLSNDDMEPLNVDLAEASIALKETFKATVWGVKVQVYDCGWEASEWLSSEITEPESKPPTEDFAQNGLRSYLSAAVATTGVLAGAYCVYHLYNEARKRKLPTTWREVGTLKDIYIYPIKSCGPVQKDRAECTLLGLKDGWLRDRTLMVVDNNYNFVTARAYPELLLVRPTIRNSVLSLQHNDMEILNMDLSEIVSLQTAKTATVWGVQVPVYDCGWEPSEWFSRLLHKSAADFRLGALPDEVPFNLINEASIDDLNSKLQGKKVCYKNFRPNFLITGARPYEEDDWKYVKIGENIFEVIKPCTRCIMTTIDPETGVRDSNAEPLETLKKYRQLENPDARRSAGDSPRMGLQMSLRSGINGIVSIDDRVYVA
ncbi:Mo-molybdopterin cofactor sulfurase [Danaus plexippus plexippus]|uniref:Mo-molybdopterin cofactor sulfurase n=1 Tax=Danaus plexippus plexippus TaxID=278856 RepID=A0A212FJA9_DANPL|nr:Mo-molybdopterin cofactor sulfurase [Danaus plexippus plexippus]